MPLIPEPLHHRLIQLRRVLHEYPELSGQEANTGAVICKFLDGLAIQYRAHVSGHGVIAEIPGRAGVPCVVLRADTDALPIQEDTGLDFTSVHDGVMHACGHDGHTTSLLGAAAVLSRDMSWNGAIHFVFQPGEENGTGAKAMIADGLFDRFPMERLFALHNWPDLEEGSVAVHNGPSMAAGGDWHVTLRGISGHAAAPHATKDPVHAAGHLIVALHSIVSRSVDPIDTVALTVSSIHGGNVSNQIPEKVELIGTLRTFREDVRAMVIGRMEDIINGIAKSFGMEVDYKINSTGRAMCDTPEESRLSILAAEVAGLKVTRSIRPSMGGDDFAFLVKDRPGAYVLIGNGPVRDGGKLQHRQHFGRRRGAVELHAGRRRKALDGGLGRFLPGLRTCSDELDDFVDAFRHFNLHAD